MTLIQEETDNRDLIELLQELDIIIFKFKKISLSILYDNEISKINSKIRRERYHQT